MRRALGLLPLVAIVILLSACSPLPSPVAYGSAGPPPIDGAGQWERFRLYTHCGFERSQIEFDGALWRPVGPGRLSDGSGNPPPGFGNPFDDGWIVRIDANEAGYQSGYGVRLLLKRLDEAQERAVCL